MANKRWARTALAVTAAATGIYWLWRREQRRLNLSPPVSAALRRRLLGRAAPLLRLPTAPDHAPEVVADGNGLRCAVTGRFYPYRDGVLDLIAIAPRLTETQQALDTPFTAWAYDRFRAGLLRAIRLPDFPAEFAAIQRHLQVQPGDVVLDLACGHGNFAVEWAKRAGPDGLVIGLDLSPAMLARAAWHVSQWQLDNVLLVRGDAQQLPFADNSLAIINCSGGFHQFPDLPRALREIARVSRPGAALAASMFAEGPADRFVSLKRWLKQRFALHFVPLAWLGGQLSELDFHQYEWSLPGGWFGYVSASRAGTEFMSAT